MIDVAAIHDALAAAGLPVVGVSQPNEVHETDGPATFFSHSAGLVRLDWEAPPEQSTIDAAKTILANSVEDVMELAS